MAAVYTLHCFLKLERGAPFLRVGVRTLFAASAAPILYSLSKASLLAASALSTLISAQFQAPSFQLLLAGIFERVSERKRMGEIRP